MSYEDPEQVALRSLTHPESPESAYAFPFEDYVVRVSAAKKDIAEYASAILTDQLLDLPLQLEAVAAIKGRSEFRRNQTIHYRHGNRPFHDREFKELGGQTQPFAVTTKAAYMVQSSDTAIADFRANDSLVASGLAVILTGGWVAIEGTISPESSTQLAEKVDEGYISHHVTLVLGRHAIHDPRSEAASDLEQPLFSDAITLERIYSSIAVPLDDSYDSRK